MRRGNGGIIGPPNKPTLSATTGVWSLTDQTASYQDDTWPESAVSVDYLIVAGGGAGGGSISGNPNGCGGGGAGGLIYRQDQILEYGTTYTLSLIHI